MTKQEAVKRLKESDHAFLLPEKAQEIAGAFNCIAKTYMATDTRSQHKGLTLHGDHKEGDQAEGIDADILARSMCDQLDLKYRSMLGRGSRLYECIAALEKTL